MNEARNSIYRDSTAPSTGFAVKLLLVHSRDDLRKSNFVHKGVELAAVGPLMGALHCVPEYGGGRSSVHLCAFVAVAHPTRPYLFIHPPHLISY